MGRRMGVLTRELELFQVTPLPSLYTRLIRLPFGS